MRMIKSSLSVGCSVTNVGAVINRPAVKSYVSTSVFGEFATFHNKHRRGGVPPPRDGKPVPYSPLNWNLRLF